MKFFLQKKWLHTASLLIISGISLHISLAQSRPDTTQAHIFWTAAQTEHAAGTTEAAAERYAQAMRAFYEAGETAPDDRPIWVRGAAALRQSQQLFAEMNQFEAALALNRETMTVYDRVFPDNARKRVPICGNWARFAYALERFPEAAEKFRQGQYYLRQMPKLDSNTLAKLHLELASTERRMGHMDQAERQFDSALVIYAQMEDSLPLALAQYQWANFQNQQGKYQAAAETLREALNVFTRRTDVPIEQTARAHGNLGSILRQLGQFDQAIEQQKIAVALMRQRYGPAHPQYALAVRMLGRTEMEMGDFRASEAHVKQAAHIIRQQLGPDHSMTAGVYDDLANVYEMMGDTERARRYLQKSAAIYEGIFGPLHESTVGTYYNLGRLEQAEDQSIAASAYYQKALGTAAASERINPALIGRIQSGLAISLMDLGRYDESLKWLAQSKRSLQGIYPPDHLEILQKDRVKAMILRQKGDLAAAYAAGQKAREAMEVAGTVPRQKQYMYYLELALTCQRMGLMEAAQQNFELSRSSVNPELPQELKAAIEIEQGAGDFHGEWGNREQALRRYQQAMQYVRRQAYYVEDASSRLALRARHAKLYPAVLEVASSLAARQPEMAAEAWSAMEQARSARLLQQVQQTHIAAFAGIPAGVIAYRRRLQQQMSEEMRRLHTQTEADSPPKRRIFDLTQKMDSLETALAATYPAYHRLYFPQALPNLADIQAALPPETALLEYLLADSLAFALLIKADTVHLHRLSLSNPLGRRISAFHTALSQAPGPGQVAQKAAVARLGYALYQDLIQPLAEALPARIIVVPDAALGYLPFEALLTDSVSADQPWHQFPFWLHQKTISYAFSGSIWLEGQPAGRGAQANKGLLAVAPDFSLLEDSASAWLPPLSYNQAEASNVVSVWGGDALIGEAATLDQFTAAANGHQILHLATHALLDETYAPASFLAFYDAEDSLLVDESTLHQTSALYLGDLYQMDLQAELAVLSACETGIGPLYRGEGISSLAQGFRFAGVPALVTTLWPISDAGSADLMQGFYTRLKTGQDKAAALRGAKLALMQARPAYNAPFYWAAYTLSGSIAPLQTSTAPWRKWLWLLLLLPLGLWLWRRSHSPSDPAH